MERDFDDPRWKAVRFACYKRDSFLCQNCRQPKKQLQCHHIIKYSENERLRFALSNLITLCTDCHQTTIGNEHRFEAQFKAMIEQKRMESKFNVQMPKSDRPKNRRDGPKLKYRPRNPRWLF